MIAFNFRPSKYFILIRLLHESKSYMSTFICQGNIHFGEIKSWRSSQLAFCQDVDVWITTTEPCETSLLLGTTVTKRSRRDMALFPSVQILNINNGRLCSLINYLSWNLEKKKCHLGSFCKHYPENIWETQIQKVASLRTYYPPGRSRCIPFTVHGVIFNHHKHKECMIIYQM